MDGICCRKLSNEVFFLEENPPRVHRSASLPSYLASKLTRTEILEIDYDLRNARTLITLKPWKSSVAVSDRKRNCARDAK